MSIDIAVVIPSYKRAGQVKSLGVVSNPILCVAESEVAEYKEYYPSAQYAVHPDDVYGLSMTRQWIYEQYPNVFMLDDDIDKVIRRYRYRVSSLTPDEVYDAIQWAGNTAKLCGAYLFGFSQLPNPLYYDPLEPILLSGFVIGATTGLLEGSKLKFIPEIVVGSDYYISALNAYYHRRCFIDTRFCFVPVETFHTPGGMAVHRTEEVEKQGTLTLRRYFGEAIKAKTHESYGGGKKRSKNYNQYGRILRLPF